MRKSLVTRRKSASLLKLFAGMPGMTERQWGTRPTYRFEIIVLLILGVCLAGGYTLQQRINKTEPKASAKVTQQTR